MNYASCQQERSDCFANVLGGCKILSYTSFDKPCPFYKSKKQFEEDRKKHPWIDYSAKKKADAGTSADEV